MKIIKRFCNRQWVSVVLYAVYLHLSFTEIVLEYDKYNLENTDGRTRGKETRTSSKERVN